MEAKLINPPSKNAWTNFELSSLLLRRINILINIHKEKFNLRYSAPTFSRPQTFFPKVRNDVSYIFKMVFKNLSFQSKQKFTSCRTEISKTPTQLCSSTSTSAVIFPLLAFENVFKNLIHSQIVCCI